jgi:hypothetical protein
MKLLDALTQLAILGATKIMLANGRTIALEHAEWLLDDKSARFELRPRETSVELFDTRGRFLGRARTLWAVCQELRSAVG